MKDVAGNAPAFAPTGLAIALVAAGAPAALLLGLFAPHLWAVAPLWITLCAALIGFDAMMGSSLNAAALGVAAPQSVGVGEEFALKFSIAMDGRSRPRRAAIAVAVDNRLSPVGRIDMPVAVDADGAHGHAQMVVTAMTRGRAALDRAWLGWNGPLGLARKHRSFALNQHVAIVPSIRAVREDGSTLFAQDAQVGQRLNARLGEGSEFESLVRFMPGFDRRAIDWKQSARHADLLAKQFETERDNRIALVIDSGRMMSEPVITPDGAREPRLDRAVSAALTLGYVALRLEDRVSLHSFDARPHVASREFARIADFSSLRGAASDIEYSLDETNYTLALASLGADLRRRAMVVVFTEFADANSAELMIRAAAPLVAKHLVVFVVMADGELEQIVTAIPDGPEAMVAATVAAELQRDRRVVFARLRRMGAVVIEAPERGMPAHLLDHYIRIKRQGMI